jgi:hypothetical protein
MIYNVKRHNVIGNRKIGHFARFTSQLSLRVNSRALCSVLLRCASKLTAFLGRERTNDNRGSICRPLRAASGKQEDYPSPLLLPLSSKR